MVRSTSISQATKLPVPVSFPLRPLPCSLVCSSPVVSLELQIICSLPHPDPHSLALWTNCVHITFCYRKLDFRVLTIQEKD